MENASDRLYQVSFENILIGISFLFQVELIHLWILEHTVLHPAWIYSASI